MKRLVLDIAKCAACKEQACSCSYPHHPYNKGIDALLSCVLFSFMCRQCREAPCIKSCPNQALERSKDAALKRYNARCTECGCCILACPFGAIVPQSMRYLSSVCDLCAGRLSDDERPVCVDSCPHGALEYLDIEESEGHERHLLSFGVPGFFVRGGRRVGPVVDRGADNR